MKKIALAFGLSLASLAASAAEVDGTYTCLTTENTQPVSVYKETLVFKTQADGSVRVTGDDGEGMDGSLSGNVVTVTNNNGSGQWVFNGEAITSTYSFADAGMTISGGSKCRRGGVVPTDNMIGAYVSADGWKNDKWVGYDAMHLDITVPNVPAGSCGKQKVWVGALLPDGRWFYHASGGWTTADASGNPPPADNGVTGIWMNQVVGEGMGATLRAIVGTQFYVGYGCSVSDMIARQTFARVYTLN